MRKRVDLLIHHGLVLAHPDRPPLEDASIACRNGLIVDIGSTQSLSERYEAPLEIDATQCLVHPGLINTHTHLAMSCYRGLGDDLPLMEWLQTRIFPAEARTNPEQVYWSSMLSFAELIRSGTTAFCDMYLFAEQVALAADRAGLRGIIGEGLFGFPSPSYGAIDNGISTTRKLIQSLQGHQLLKGAVMPHAPYTCPPALLQLASRIAREEVSDLHIHLAETRFEVEESRMNFGTTPIRHLEQLGVLGSDVIAAHCVWVDDEELDILAKRGVRVAHNPESNMKLASGVAPIVAMRKRGIPVGLGTDGSASNNDLDMYREMDSACKLQKVHHLDATVMSAKDAFRMATLDGANVLGLGDKCGSLEPGKSCDLAIVELQNPHLIPLYNPISQLVYSAKGSDVRDTIVHGKVLMRNRKLLTLDLGEIYDHMSWIQNKVIKDIQ